MPTLDLDDPTSGNLTLTTDDLVVGVNTALTLERAQFLATVNTEFAAWNALSLQERIAGLLGAWQQMKLIPLKAEGFVWRNVEDRECRACFTLYDLSVEDYAALPEQMHEALEWAAMQTAMTNTAAGACNADEQREQGILHSRSKDSSHMFRPGIPLRLPIPRGAINRLGPWLCMWNARTARV